MNWFKRSYNKEISYLNKYLRKGFNAEDYYYYLIDFLEQKGSPLIDEMYENQTLNKQNLFDNKDLYRDDEEYFIDNWFQQSSPKEIEEFKEYISNKNLDATRDTAPPYEVMDYKNFIKPTWLVHFTDEPDSISSKGFIKGWENIQGLGYTSFYKNYGSSGYNFAFRVDNSRDIRSAARGGKYGKHAVVFWGSGVEASHYGDNEDQVIVWGPSINTDSIIPIYRDSDGGWKFERTGTYDTYPMIQSEDINDIISWVVNNNEMARRILRKWKPSTKKKKHELV